MKKKTYDAYMTIEASFIIPLSFLLIIMTLYLGFFCYEKSVSVQCCYLAALRGSNEWELSGQSLEVFVGQTLEQLVNEKYLYQIKREYCTNANIAGVEVSMDEYMNIPFSKIRGDDINGWNINSKKEAFRNKPASYIRKYQILNE